MAQSVDHPTVHAPGWCLTYGSAGRKSPFAPELPAFANVPAKELSLEAQALLSDVCGPLWEGTSHACCDSSQIQVLSDNLERVAPLIASCPACRQGFNQLFCHFTCSPNQSQFINVTATSHLPNGKIAVDELDFYLNSVNALQFFDSCKNIKIGATNGLAMDLIGGGATNYTGFLKFLGDKKPQLGGSPFQINFDYNLTNNEPLELLNWDTRDCNDTDPNFACACSDCPPVCPLLEKLPSHNSNAFNKNVSNFILFSYFILLVSYFGILKYWRYTKSKKNTVFLDDNQDENDNDNFLETTNTLTSSAISFDSANLQNIKTKKSYIINNYFERLFYNLGYICSTYPKMILAISTLVILIFSSFISFIKFETNPVNLWVSPSSDVYLQKQVFDESFGPFYRTQQIILSNATGDSILQDYEFIKWWFDKEEEIRNIQSAIFIDDTEYNVTYDDICFKPLEDTCILESFTQYFDGDINNLPAQSWKNKIKSCANSPVECLPTFQQPLKPNLLFGKTSNDTDDILTSSSIIITLLNNNNNDANSKQVQMASSWENTLESYLLYNLTNEANELGVDISFMTEVSLEKELNKSTNTDIPIVIISYLIMFIYASYSLSMNQLNNNISFVNSSFCTPFGKVSGNNPILQFFSKTKLSLGLIGILIVLFSVFVSMGFWSLMGLKSTLIIAEVIPFLILAVGIDNIFLISNELNNIERLSITNNLNLNVKIAKTMSNIGPSILLSSLAQFFCFSLGSFVSMPAVKNFSLYTSVAVLVNTLLQITTFVSILTLEQRRVISGKLDLIPFISIESNSVSLPVEEGRVHNDEGDSNLIQMLNESDNVQSNGIINNFFQNKFVPYIFRKDVKSFILFIFLSIFGISLSLIPKIQLGLDQRLALPSDSYLIDYFNDMYDHLNVGPPIYFVVDGLNVTDQSNQKQLCSKFTTCDSYSLVNLINGEFSRSNESSIAEPISSWIDDYLLWLNPDLSDCCRLKIRNDDEFCAPFASPRMCKSCFDDREWDYQMNGFPEGDEFMKFFNEWIEAPSYPCPLGGKAPYSSSIYVNDYGVIERSAFRTSHVPLRSQDDFINAYLNSLRVVKEVEKYHPELDVFAYSPFYIFFKQYETIKKLTLVLLLLGVIIINFISLLFLGSVRNSIVLVINLVFIMVNIVGWMVLNGISLNAVSLVNLLICLGLSVEFSIHLFKHFNYNETLGNREERARDSLGYIGSITLCGITLTKLIGIGVLSFTHSQIFRVYYFKMWAGLIIIASVHSLIFAPLLLSIWGSSTVYERSPWGKLSNDGVLTRS